MDGTQPAPIRALVRRLMVEAHVAPAGADPPHPDGPPPEPEAPETVVFETEVDGVRCVMLRAPAPADATPPLSPREREIVRLIAKGYPNKTIAAVLEISVWTVNSHVRRVFSKLRVTSRAAMVARFLDGGVH